MDCAFVWQVAQQLQRDERLVVMERTNLRHLTAADLRGPRPELVTLDLSFISVLTVLPAVVALLAPAAELVSLIKPQFEARQAQVMLQPRCQMVRPAVAAKEAWTVMHYARLHIRVHCVPGVLAGAFHD